MDAAAADAEEAAAAAHHEAAQRQAAAAGAAPGADDDAQDMDVGEDGEEADDMEADAPEEGRPGGTTKECMECGEEKVALLKTLLLLAALTAGHRFTATCMFGNHLRSQYCMASAWWTVCV
jgi:hypothetical protein